MKNNFRVATANSKTDKVTILLTMTNNDIKPQNPAASLVLGEILSEGSMLRNQEAFDLDLAKNGIGLSSGSEYNSITSSVVCNSDDLTKALEAMKENIENPRFTQEEFEHAKNNIKEEFRKSYH